MNVDMQNHLKGYFAQVDAVDRPIDPGEVVERLEPVAPIPRRADGPQNRWRGPRVALVAAAVAAVAVLIAVLPSITDGTTPSEEPASDPVPGSTVPLETVTTIQSAPPAPEPPARETGSTDGLIWRQLTLDPEPGFLWGPFGRFSSGDLIAIESDGYPDRCWSQGRGNFECDPSEPPTGAEALSDTPTVAVISPDGVVSSVALDEVSIIHENFVRDGYLVLAAAAEGDALDTIAITSDGFEWDYRSLPAEHSNGHLYGHGGFVVLGETVVIWSQALVPQGAPLLASSGSGEQFVPVLGTENSTSSDDELRMGFTAFTFEDRIYAIDHNNTMFGSDDAFGWTAHGTVNGLPPVEGNSDERWIGEVGGKLIAWIPSGADWRVFESSDPLTWTEVRTDGARPASQAWFSHSSPEGFIAVSYDMSESERFMLSRDGQLWIDPPPDPRPNRTGLPPSTHLRDASTLWVLEAVG